MERLAYSQKINKEINEMKEVYYQLQFKDKMYEAHEAMRSILCKEDIQDMVKKYHYEEEIYLSLKYLGDHALNKSQLEETLIYMNLFLGNHYLPKQIYFKKLSTLILSCQNFGIIIEDYCLLRHMMSFEEIEAWVLNQENYNIYRLLEIYLLEQRFDRLEPYLDLLKGNEMILPYEKAIRYYDRTLYKKLFDKKKNYCFPLAWRAS